MYATRLRDSSGNKDKCRWKMMGSVHMCKPTIIIYVFSGHMEV